MLIQEQRQLIMSVKWNILRLAVACWVMSTGSWAMAQTAVGPVLEVPLFPGFDNFGYQFEVVQAYGDGPNAVVSFGIYDTGASVATLSNEDQDAFTFLGSPVPIKVPNGASATAIGGSGTLTGDVSDPGTLTAAGMSAFAFDPVTLDFTINLSSGVAVPGIQMFVGTASGSPDLPNIVGTPIHAPGSLSPLGSSARIDMRGYEFDLGLFLPGDPLFAGIKLTLPDVEFLAPGATLTPDIDTYVPVNIPVRLYGEDSTANPGDLPSTGHNPVIDLVSVTKGANQVGSKTYLFDTGAQLSIISEEIALGLGLDLNSPEDTIQVQGASGTVSVPGFTIDSLEIPRSDGGVVRFLDVPIYVLDIGEGIDGILGMNLFNGADGLVYDPFGPNGPLVSMTFLNNRTLTEEENLQELYDDLTADIDGALIAELLAAFGNRFADAQFVVAPGVRLVPEPCNAVLVIIAASAVALMRRRRERC